MSEPSPLRILYLGMKWDYGDPARGTSFEESSFHAGFRAHPGVEVTHFDFMEQARTLGRPAMNRELLKTVEEGDFDCLFHVLFTDELDADVVDSITARERPVTIGWGCDDHWRFDEFSSRWAPHYNWWVTTARSALRRFAAMGYSTVIKSQWAVEPTAYFPTGDPRELDVSFVGLPHGDRVQVMRRLHERGVDVAIFGAGWDGLRTRITHEQMLRVFSASRVCLNLSNSSVGATQQIKGRVFEVPACRSLLLTDIADDLASYFAPGKEVVVYESFEDLVRQIRYYLDNDDEREAIAEAGYRRTLAEHTWRHRFDAIFESAGLR